MLKKKTANIVNNNKTNEDQNEKDKDILALNDYLKTLDDKIKGYRNAEIMMRRLDAIKTQLTILEEQDNNGVTIKHLSSAPSIKLGLIGYIIKLLTNVTGEVTNEDNNIYTKLQQAFLSSEIRKALNVKDINDLKNKIIGGGNKIYDYNNNTILEFCMQIAKDKALYAKFEKFIKNNYTSILQFVNISNTEAVLKNIKIKENELYVNVSGSNTGHNGVTAITVVDQSLVTPLQELFDTSKKNIQANDYIVLKIKQDVVFSQNNFNESVYRKEMSALSENPLLKKEDTTFGLRLGTSLVKAFFTLDKIGRKKKVAQEEAFNKALEDLKTQDIDKILQVCDAIKQSKFNHYKGYVGADNDLMTKYNILLKQKEQADEKFQEFEKVKGLDSVDKYSKLYSYIQSVKDFRKAFIEYDKSIKDIERRQKEQRVNDLDSLYKANKKQLEKIDQHIQAVKNSGQSFLKNHQKYVSIIQNSIDKMKEIYSTIIKPIIIDKSKNASELSLQELQSKFSEYISCADIISDKNIKKYENDICNSEGKTNNSVKLFDDTEEYVWVNNNIIGIKNANNGLQSCIKDLEGISNIQENSLNTIDENVVKKLKDKIKEVKQQRDQISKDLKNITNICQKDSEFVASIRNEIINNNKTSKKISPQQAIDIKQDNPVKIDKIKEDITALRNTIDGIKNEIQSLIKQNQKNNETLDEKKKALIDKIKHFNLQGFIKSINSVNNSYSHSTYEKILQEHDGIIASILEKCKDIQEQIKLEEHKHTFDDNKKLIEEQKNITTQNLSHYAEQDKNVNKLYEDITKEIEKKKEELKTKTTEFFNKIKDINNDNEFNQVQNDIDAFIKYLHDSVQNAVNNYQVSYDNCIKMISSLVNTSKKASATASAYFDKIKALLEKDKQNIEEQENLSKVEEGFKKKLEDLETFFNDKINILNKSLDSAVESKNATVKNDKDNGDIQNKIDGLRDKVKINDDLQNEIKQNGNNSKQQVDITNNQVDEIKKAIYEYQKLFDNEKKTFTDNIDNIRKGIKDHTLSSYDIETQILSYYTKATEAITSKFNTSYDICNHANTSCNTAKSTSAELLNRIKEILNQLLQTQELNNAKDENAKIFEDEINKTIQKLEDDNKNNENIDEYEKNIKVADETVDKCQAALKDKKLEDSVKQKPQQVDIINKSKKITSDCVNDIKTQKDNLTNAKETLLNLNNNLKEMYEKYKHNIESATDVEQIKKYKDDFGDYFAKNKQNIEQALTDKKQIIKKAPELSKKAQDAANQATNALQVIKDYQKILDNEEEVRRSLDDFVQQFEEKINKLFDDLNIKIDDKDLKTIIDEITNCHKITTSCKKQTENILDIIREKVKEQIDIINNSYDITDDAVKKAKIIYDLFLDKIKTAQKIKGDFMKKKNEMERFLHKTEKKVDIATGKVTFIIKSDEPNIANDDKDQVNEENHKDEEAKYTLEEYQAKLSEFTDFKNQLNKDYNDVEKDVEQNKQNLETYYNDSKKAAKDAQDALDIINQITVEQKEKMEAEKRAKMDICTDLLQRLKQAIDKGQNLHDLARKYHDDSKDFVNILGGIHTKYEGQNIQHFTQAELDVFNSTMTLINNDAVLLNTENNKELQTYDKLKDLFNKIDKNKTVEETEFNKFITDTKTSLEQYIEMMDKIAINNSIELNKRSKLVVQTRDKQYQEGDNLINDAKKLFGDIQSTLNIYTELYSDDIISNAKKDIDNCIAIVDEAKTLVLTYCNIDEGETNENKVVKYDENVVNDKLQQAKIALNKIQNIKKEIEQKVKDIEAKRLADEKAKKDLLDEIEQKNNEWRPQLDDFIKKAQQIIQESDKINNKLEADKDLYDDRHAKIIERIKVLYQETIDKSNTTINDANSCLNELDESKNLQDINEKSVHFNKAKQLFKKTKYDINEAEISFKQLKNAYIALLMMKQQQDAERKLEQKEEKHKEEVKKLDENLEKQNKQIKFGSTGGIIHISAPPSFDDDESKHKKGKEKKDNKKKKDDRKNIDFGKHYDSSYKMWQLILLFLNYIPCLGIPGVVFKIINDKTLQQYFKEQNVHSEKLKDLENQFNTRHVLNPSLGNEKTKQKENLNDSAITSNTSINGSYINTENSEINLDSLSNAKYII